MVAGGGVQVVLFGSVQLQSGRPVAERACAEVLALPIHPALSASAQAYVVEQIAAFYRR